MKTKLRNLICGLLPIALTCFGLAPLAQAVGPDTDGAIPGSNNGEGIGVLVSRTTGIWNTGTGFEALNHLTAGNQNTATGVRSLFNDINGGFNTATGVFSLFSNTNGFFNSATGAYSLANNIGGNQNTANGYGALYSNTADANTATGFGALFKNTTGSLNTANGHLALNRNTTGSQNVAIGESALFSNTTGDGNTATGDLALFSNTTGTGNTAIGVFALDSNTTGNDNTATGDGALFSNTTGVNNTAIGRGALLLSTTGVNNTAIGRGAGANQTIGSNNVYIGANVFGVAGESDACYIRSIFGQTSTGGTQVFVNSNGKLGTVTSSRRFKEEIKPMEEASQILLALRPVSFRYKSEIDPAGTRQFGLVAEEVEKLSPDLVVRDEIGEIYTVRYEAVNAMLLNEFLKVHRKAQQQEATIAQLKQDFAEQRKQIEVLTAGLEKVSARLEVSKSAPQMAVNNQ